MEIRRDENPYSVRWQLHAFSFSQSQTIFLDAESHLLQGLEPSQLGLNERFSSGVFGDGSYLAEDPGKADQYCKAGSGQSGPIGPKGVGVATGCPDWLGGKSHHFTAGRGRREIFRRPKGQILLIPEGC